MILGVEKRPNGKCGKCGSLCIQKQTQMHESCFRPEKLDVEKW